MKEALDSKILIFVIFLSFLVFVETLQGMLLPEKDGTF